MSIPTLTNKINKDMEQFASQMIQMEFLECEIAKIKEILLNV